MGDYDGGDENTDQAFIMRLPQQIADKVRGMIRANDFKDLELKVDKENQAKGFKGRTGQLSVGAMELPATFLDLPTLVETYRTIDGKSGDYVKSGEASQIMMVHENLEEAKQLRASRPSGRYHSGITPPTYKITREFAKFRPHYSQLLRNRKVIPKNALRRAENHICRISKKTDKGQEGGGGDDDTEIEEVEVECDSPRSAQQEEVEEVGGGLPYRGQDGVMYYAKNGRAYLHATDQRVGFLASKVVFKQLVRGYGVIVVAKCDMPRKMRVQDNQRPMTGGGEEVDEDELDAEIEGQEGGSAAAAAKGVKDLEDRLHAEMEEEEAGGEAVVAAEARSPVMDRQLAHELGDDSLQPAQREVFNQDFEDAGRSPNQTENMGRLSGEGVAESIHLDMAGEGEEGGAGEEGAVSEGMQGGIMGEEDGLQLARSPPLPKSPGLVAVATVGTPNQAATPDPGMAMGGMPPEMAMPEGMGMGEMPTDDQQDALTEWQQFDDSQGMEPMVAPPGEGQEMGEAGQEGEGDVEMAGADAVWEDAGAEGGGEGAEEEGGMVEEAEAAMEEVEEAAPLPEEAGGLSAEERAELEQQLAELEGQLAGLEEAVGSKEKALAAAPNQVLKKRIQMQITPLATQRDQKLAEVNDVKQRLGLL